MKTLSVLAVLIAGTALSAPVLAQDATRIDMLENQIRALTGQVEELTFAVKQMQKQLPQQSGELQLQPSPAVPQKRKTAQLAAPQDGSGIEVIEENSLSTASSAPAGDAIVSGGNNDGGQLPPGAKVLGSMASKAAQPGDGGFEGQVLVPLGTDGTGQGVTDAENGSGIEQVALAPETPQSLFEQSNELLLRRQFPQAAAGFQKLLDTYPDHSLAGSAQYWLGETYYAQGDYRTAAQNFLSGYQKFPKSRRAPDSLVKLGMSLGKLGQHEQACTSLASVASEYPKAVEAKKRAQAELRRAGC